jgi:hypothetical protein
MAAFLIGFGLVGIALAALTRLPIPHDDYLTPNAWRNHR